MKMEFRDLVRRRRMVRQFQPSPIARDVLFRVLEVARHAPSAGFSQLGVPEGCRPIGVIALGYPAADSTFDPSVFTARRRSLESMVRFGHWERPR